MQEERKKNNTQSNSRRQSPKSQNFPKENEDLDREKKEEVNQALTPKKSLKRKDPPEENENREGLGEKLSDFKNHKKKKPKRINLKVMRAQKLQLNLIRSLLNNI